MTATSIAVWAIHLGCATIIVVLSLLLVWAATLAAVRMYHDWRK